MGLMANPLRAQEAAPLATPEATLHIAYQSGDANAQVTCKWPCNDVGGDIQVARAYKHRDGGAEWYLTITPTKDIVLDRIELVLPEPMDSARTVFCNGFQSWTTSTEYGLNDKIRRISAVGKAFAHYYGDYDFYKYPAKRGLLHGWTYTYVRQTDGRIGFVGSLNEFTGYASFLHNTSKGLLTVGKDCKGLHLKAGEAYDVFRLYAATGDDSTVFANYFRLFRQELGAVASQQGVTTIESKAVPQTGWTSWYNYYNKISEGLILDNLHNFAQRKTPIGVFQIDDGYQKATGDWIHTNDHFPNGMKRIADSVHAAGYLAGIWLAPFICERKSFIVTQHPDWLLKGKTGKPIVVGINPLWSGKYYALDIYNPEVRGYLKTVFDTVLHGWGYDLVKLDFLFAAALNPPANKTRGQVMVDGMLLLRQLVGQDKFIDGCGAPIGPAFCLTDYCRVSSDIHMKWEQLLLKAMKARERLSTWNSLTGAIGRWQLAGNAFQNDPDVYVLRKEHQHLKPAQQHTMLLVDNLFGRLSLTSDDIGLYDSTRLAAFLSALPYQAKRQVAVQQTGQLYKAAFMIGDRSFMAYINLSKHQQSVATDSATYFNNSDNSIIKPQTKLVVKPYSSICLYRLKGEPFEVLGGSNNLFSGTEVESFQLLNAQAMQLRFRKGFQQNHVVVMSIPKEFQKINVNGKPTVVRTINGINCLLYTP